ncbi:MAG: cytochrome c family protein [Erythrobacter sp.]|nr:cytochrome c family protein [Erythrobacter sp.]
MNDRKNTAIGWILGSGIVALGLWIISSKYFGEERPEEMGYAIAGAEETGGAEAAGPDLGTLLASGSIEAGEKIFAKCTACHTANQGGANGIGPNLFGVMGKPVGSHVAGFAYSPALSGHGGEWNWETMDAWLTSPKKFASGTKMSFAGLSKPEDRANVMLYLEANGGAPAKPAPAAPAAEETAAAGDADATAEGEAAAPSEQAGA